MTPATKPKAIKFTKENKLKILRRMRELIARPYGWRKGSLFGNSATGDRVPSVCLLGAEYVAIAEIRGGHGGFYYNALQVDPGGEKLSIRNKAKELGFDGVAAFNDNRGTKKKDVLSFLDNYIAELEG